MPRLEKVAHLTRRFVPEKWGGTEQVVSQISKALIQGGVDSPVFCTDMLSQPGTDTFDGVSVRRYPYVFPWLGLSTADKRRLELKGGSPLSLSLFTALLRESGVSLIHTHVQHRLGGMARTAARLKRIPYVVSVHGGLFTTPMGEVEKMMEPFRGKPEWGKAFGALLGARRTLEDADAIICVGADEREEVARRFVGKPVFYQPNGVDVDRFSQADGAAFRTRYGFAAADKLVLGLSRIDHQKNQLGLVRAFARFAADHPEHRLVLVGPVTVEAYRDTLVAEAEALGIADRVSIIEGIRPDDPMLPGAYAAAELFVLPSVHEPFGIVVLEAWAAGVPVIASRVGGVPGFTEHETNILHVEPNDEAALAQQMARLAGDVALRTDLSRRAFGDVASRYDWSRIARETVAIYEQILTQDSLKRTC